MDILFHLISRTPVHKALVYLAVMVLDRKPKEILADFGERPMLEFRDYLKEQFRANPRFATYSIWFKSLADNKMDCRLNEFFKDTADPEKRIQYWAKDVHATLLVARTLAEVPEGPKQLMDCAKWVRGHIRAKVKEQDVNDVVQGAWKRIFRQLPKYDPSIAGFRTFALPCVQSAIADYYRDEAGTLPLIDDLRPDQVSGEQAPSGPCAPYREDLVAKIFTSLERVYNDRIPPHELLAFSLNLLSWRPAEVWEELASEELRLLLPKLERDLINQARWHADFVRRMFAKLSSILHSEISVEQVLENEKTVRFYREKCPALLKRRVGDTTFSAYVSDGADRLQFSADFSNWCTNVMKRVRKEFLEEHDDE